MSPDNAIRIRTLTGRAIMAAAADFQSLHVAVFQEWPYLYAGNPRGQPYIARYADHPRAALFVASHDGMPIGAATCLPLEDETPNIQAPFLSRGWDMRRFFYFGEGIVLAQWRGQGVGLRFFAARESHARAVSTADFTVFCSVRRPAQHRMRHANAHTNDAFWRRRGYAPLPGMACTMSWTDIGDTEPSAHTLDFWIKSLHGAPLPCV